MAANDSFDAYLSHKQGLERCFNDEARRKLIASQSKEFWSGNAPAVSGVSMFAVKPRAVSSTSDVVKSPMSPKFGGSDNDS
jgi:hypothetical protein